jgi:hypothetical protein
MKPKFTTLRFNMELKRVLIAGAVYGHSNSRAKEIVESYGYQVTEDVFDVDFILRGSGWQEDPKYGQALRNSCIRDVMIDPHSFSYDLDKYVFEGTDLPMEV